MSEPDAPGRTAPRDEGDDRRVVADARRLRAPRASRPASRSSTTCSSSSASTRASTCTIEAKGDLDVDLHHTVEDVGIVLGNALREALGDKRGVRRFANSLVPLDEALVEVALDLSGRPFLVYAVDPISEWIGTFDPQLCEEFWKGFVDGARVTLHLRSISGKNGHHVIEASFKGVARALRDAVKIEGDDVPVDQGHAVRHERRVRRASRSSTTGSAICDRRRRRCSTSAPTPRSPPTSARSNAPTRSCSPAWARSARA